MVFCKSITERNVLAAKQGWLLFKDKNKYDYHKRSAARKCAWLDKIVGRDVPAEKSHVSNLKRRAQPALPFELTLVAVQLLPNLKWAKGLQSMSD